MRISVALCTYNGEKFLSRQLENISAQSRQVNELIICDDGSSDGTLGIVTEYSAYAGFPVTVVQNEKNLGCAKNFEKAMGLCSGDIIVLCDQDDIWLPDKIKVLESVFIKNANCGMTFTDAQTIDEAEGLLSRSLWACVGLNNYKRRIIKHGKGYKIFSGNNFVTGATAAVTKSFFEEALPFPEGLLHDHWLATVAAVQKRLCFSEEFTIQYRRHVSQQVGCNTPMSFQKRIALDASYDQILFLTAVVSKALKEKKLLTKKHLKIFFRRTKYYTFRKNLPRNRFVRLFKILGHLLKGNYRLFGSGVYSAVKDFLKRNAR
ncbi:MAG: glycosyltransferase family 2 protein [Defluviitaleaceae bacterium]|nr:glycosyltransferase family 2 protein [Defluviitaleaceae bacterium]